MATTAAHKRGPWSGQEDQILMDLVTRHGPSNWVEISKVVGTRSAKQCRERYHQSLNPALNHSPITLEEGYQIYRLVGIFGTRWAEIARRMNGRSDNFVKNWWNGLYNRLKRRLAAGEAGLPENWYTEEFLLAFAELHETARRQAAHSAAHHHRRGFPTNRPDRFPTALPTAHPTGFLPAHAASHLAPSTSMDSTVNWPSLTPLSRTPSLDFEQYRPRLEAPLMSPSVSDPGPFSLSSNYTTSPAPPRSRSLDMERPELTTIYNWRQESSDNDNTWLPGVRFLQDLGHHELDSDYQLPPIRNSSQLPTAPNTPMTQQDSPMSMPTPEQAEPPKTTCRKISLEDLLS
ncbi:hypothetical protein E4U42_000013 [Claviceps africana]|uniref:Uncharacterized protein n=1 Tax=Claviceps africana TaxID=83212 RepID=A0A8K0NPQ8_9HYPO|nr:hypothetical protein E4U42_000013 [Claviceps africana]